jgi:hypothetical protein
MERRGARPGGGRKEEGKWGLFLVIRILLLSRVIEKGRGGC